MKKIRVSAAVIKDGDKILATERGYGEFKGFWEFPGGKREDGESGEETAIREIKEELGVDITIDSFICTVEYQYEAFHLTMDCYFAHLDKGYPSLHEHMAMKWIGLDEIDSLEWLPADLIVIDKIKS